MSNICEFCLNYTEKKEAAMKTRENCTQESFVMDEDENMLICENFTMVICPDISSAVIERFLRKDINFYNNLCDLTSIILTMFSYQNIFKIIFDIEKGNIEFLDLTNSQHTYGVYDIHSIELKKGIVSFESNDELRNLILGVVEPESLVFIEFKDFEYKYPIRGVFTKPHRFYNKNKLSLLMLPFSGQDAWLE